MAETTHTTDPETGRAIQIVPPAQLRAILDEQGSSYSRPHDFGDEDEWDVGAGYEDEDGDGDGEAHTYTLGELRHGRRALIRDDGVTVARVDSDEGPVLVGELSEREVHRRFPGALGAAEEDHGG